MNKYGRRFYLGLCCVVAVCGCRSDKHVQEWTPVAWVRWQKADAGAEIVAELERHNISATAGGSRIYDIYVQKDKVLTALSLLKTNKLVLDGSASLYE